MGRSYSINGYINAVKQRSAKTLLLEGPTDRGALRRIMTECHLCSTHTVVDEAGLFENGDLNGYGEKQKILRTISRVHDILDKHPELGHKFATLIDREWDGLRLEPFELVNEWSAPEQSSNNFITTGHSIENYYFTQEYVVDYLKHAHSEYLTTTFRDTIQTYFPKAIALAVAVSFAMNDAKVFSRSKQMFGIGHIDVDRETIRLSSEFSDAALKRGIDEPELLRLRINDSLNEGWTVLASKPHAKWLPHGHIGSDVIWACIGAIALYLGVHRAACDSIAHGNQEERRRHWHSWLACTCSDAQPLPATIEWMKR